MERTVTAWTAIMSPQETPRTQRARERAGDAQGGSRLQRTGDLSDSGDDDSDLEAEADATPEITGIVAGEGTAELDIDWDSHCQTV